MSPSRLRSTLRRGGWLLAFALGGLLAACATRGISTKVLEAKPIVQTYEKLCNEAETTRSQSEGCPSCVY
jgi:hypothetical protein